MKKLILLCLMASICNPTKSLTPTEIKVALKAASIGALIAAPSAGYGAYWLTKPSKYGLEVYGTKQDAKKRGAKCAMVAGSIAAAGMFLYRKKQLPSTQVAQLKQLLQSRGWLIKLAETRDVDQVCSMFIRSHYPLARSFARFAGCANDMGKLIEEISNGIEKYNLVHREVLMCSEAVKIMEEADEAIEKCESVLPLLRADEKFYIECNALNGQLAAEEAKKQTQELNEIKTWTALNAVNNMTHHR